MDGAPEVSNELDLLYTEVEDDLRRTVREALTDRCDPTSVAALYDGERALASTLWKTVGVDLGLAGILVPEGRGGAGASAREAAVVLEELGRAVAPVPYLTSSVVATTVLLATESELVGSLASGERVGTLVVPFSTGPDQPLPGVSVGPDGRLTGAVTSVAGALEADLLLVPVAGDAGTALYAVDTRHARVDPVVSLDMTRQLSDVTLTAAPGELVVPDGETVVRHGLRVGAALLASEQLGVARACLDDTVAYLMMRRQFGRPLGGFQALKHRLADLSTEVDSANAVARYAAAAVEGGDLPVAARIAQAFCSDLAVHVAEETVQLHGGIGMTWEHPAHLYLKRAKANQIAMGTAGAHRAELAGLIDLPGSAAG